MKNHFADWLTLPANTITGSMALDRLALMEKNIGMTQAASSIKLLRGLYRLGMALHRITQDGSGENKMVRY